MQTTLSPIPQITTNRPAPILTGFCAIQALSNDGINITQYHRKSGSLLTWFCEMVEKKVFDGFALFTWDDRWRVCDRHGKRIETRTSITPKNGVFRDSCEPLHPNLDEYTQSVKEILGASVIPLTFAVHHADASSVGHSNTLFVTRNMIMNASDEDLEHVYFTDGILNGCRIQSWFMDADAVSKELMDQYLEHYKPLTKGWPLNIDNYLEILAHRMASLRPRQVISILQIVGKHADLGESPEQVDRRLQQIFPDDLIILTSMMLDEIYEGVYIKGTYDNELFEKGCIIENAERIADIYRNMFLF